MLAVDKFGKYEIVRKLGRSMTDVYLAHDTENNRLVVLKLIEESRDEFTQLIIEAERRGAVLQSQLHALDRRILEVYEHGELNGCLYVAMQYCEGQTLAAILQAQRRLAPDRAARYGAEICSQLRTLHAFTSDLNGYRTAVIHGDIKPSNVQISANDDLHLLDFGIAKVITSTRNLTRHNLGSPTYCSPERISKSQVDQDADLWAVGVTLYEMLAGMPPYQAQSTRRLEALIQSRRPPRALPPDCPPALKAIVAKSLACDLEKRYRTAEQFEADLRAFLSGRETTAEREHVTPWEANATVERRSTRPHVPVPVPAAVASRQNSGDTGNVVIALLAGVLVGLLLLIPGGQYYHLRAAARALRSHTDYSHADVKSIKADWAAYRQLENSAAWLGSFSPAASLDAAVHNNLVNSAENIIYRFRNSSDPDLNDFDWEKARLCLSYAVQIKPSDWTAKGELALCQGYLRLLHDPKPQRPDGQAIKFFEQAQVDLPRSPDPPLALARTYIYCFHNIGAALAQFHLAEQLGAHLGPRETEQEADGYLFRAQVSLARAKRVSPAAKVERAKWLEMAHADIERARALYEPIMGFATVSANLEQLQEARLEQAELETENVHVVPVQARSARRYSSVHRW